MRVYYDRDCDINLIKDKKVAILGYGSQGHAHALNLRDSGAKNLVVALRPGSPSAKKAEGEGLKVMGIAEAAAWCDLIMFTMPDELQAETYRKYVHDNLREGAAIAFAHGLNVHFGLIEPKKTVDVLMVAPKGPGHTVRGEYQKGGGVPCLIAVHHDATGGARDRQCPDRHRGHQWRGADQPGSGQPWQAHRQGRGRSARDPTRTVQPGPDRHRAQQRHCRRRGTHTRLFDAARCIACRYCEGAESHWCVGRRSCRHSRSAQTGRRVAGRVGDHMSGIIAPLSSAPTGTTAPDPALHQVAQQFEAVFLRQIIGAMRQAKLSDDLFGSSATDQFREMADARTADSLASTGQFGIAALIEKQFAGAVMPRKEEK